LDYFVALWDFYWHDVEICATVDRSALDVLPKLKGRDVILHMIDRGGDVTRNGIGKLVCRTGHLRRAINKQFHDRAAGGGAT
jgi:hypothetical protein